MNQIKKPTKYEETAIKAIHAWKNPTLGWFGKVMEVINYPLDKAGDLVMKAPGVGWVIEKSVGGLVSVLNDAAHWSIRPTAIYEEYRDDGCTVNCADDIYKLDLEKVDKTIGYLGAKYKSIALAEGATTGLVGLPGIPPDVIAIVVLNLRAIGEYATYYGFDVTRQEERLFALNVLGLASSPTDAAKQVAMAQLVKIAKDVAMKRTWKELEQHAFVVIIQQIAKALGIRLTKAKLAQAIPIAGAAVGGGYNAYFTDKVCDAAYYLYRERFLARKYGENIIEATVNPASDYKPDYSDEFREIKDLSIDAELGQGGKCKECSTVISTGKPGSFAWCPKCGKPVEVI